MPLNSPFDPGNGVWVVYSENEFVVIADFDKIKFPKMI